MLFINLVGANQGKEISTRDITTLLTLYKPPLNLGAYFSNAVGLYAYLQGLLLELTLMCEA